MSRGCRYIFLAIAGLAIAGAQQPAEQTQAASRPQQAQTTPKPTTPPAQTAQPPYRPYTDRYSDACYNAQNHDTADLCAQWRAAIATEKAAKEARIATIAAIIGVVLSLATVVGLIVTIWQTHGALGEARRGNRLNLAFERRSRRESRKAAEDQERALAIAERNAESAKNVAAETVKTTKAMMDSNEIARETMMHQARARIVVDTFFWTGNLGDGYRFGALIKNAGPTVPVRMRIFTDSRFLDHPLPPDFEFPTEEQFIITGSAGPNSQAFMGPSVPRDRTLKAQDWYQIEEGSKHFYIFGWIRYFDIFKPEQERVTKFCASPRSALDPNGQQIFAFQMFDRHNCADEGCEDC